MDLKKKMGKFYYKNGAINPSRLSKVLRTSGLQVSLSCVFS